MGQRSRPQRTSHLWRVIVALGLGFVTTLGFVARGWHVSRMDSFGGSQVGHRTEGGKFSMPDGRAYRWTDVDSRWFRGRSLFRISSRELGWDEGPYPSTIYAVRRPEVRPSWADVEQVVAGMIPGDRGCWEFQYGYPFRCLREAVAADFDRPVDEGRVLAGTDIGWPAQAYAIKKILPTSPLWPGLLADVAIFGAAWLLIFEIGLLTRRAIVARRVKVGECASCRYDRAGLTPEAACPECGLTPGER